jgi:hypothetical protein
MNNEEKNGKGVSFTYNPRVLKIEIFASLLLIAVLTVVAITHSNTTKKYEAVIAELESEVDRLSDPVAVHEVATKTVSLDLIQSSIKDIGELATVEYLYTDAGKYENPKQLFGKDIPFTTKSFIAKWDGTIKAGVDIEQVVVEINDEKKLITIHLPKAEILSHEIDENSIETLDEQDGLFNPVNVDDVRAFDKASKLAMEERAIGLGLLDNATENAKDIIEKLVKNDVVMELGYTVKFKEIV